MKTMTCKDLGGTCDQKLSAESWNEMVGLMVKHVTENHPDVAKQMEQMHNEDPKKWGRETKPRWEATPEGPAANELETLGRAYRSRAINIPKLVHSTRFPAETCQITPPKLLS
jgi:predicted small metal-binding protein